MKRILFIVSIMAAAALAHGQATVMVNSNTGVLRSPTNLVQANGIATVVLVTQSVASVRAELTNVADRVTVMEELNGFSPILGLGSTSLVTRSALDVVDGVYPVGANGRFWESSVVNGELSYRSTNAWYNWFDGGAFYVVSQTPGSTNGPCWMSFFYRNNSYDPYNGATGSLAVSVIDCQPGAQLGAGVNSSPGTFQWLEQPIADGTQGIYIGGRWITNSTAIAYLAATNRVLTWDGHAIATSNGMTAIGGVIWTNQLITTNISFILTVSTNTAGEIQTTTGTAVVVTIR